MTLKKSVTGGKGAQERAEKEKERKAKEKERGKEKKTESRVRRWLRTP